MKNLTYILFVVFTLTLMSFSCQKEDIATPQETGITAEDLVGNWMFESLVMPDNSEYTNCSQTPSGDWWLVLYNFENVSTNNTLLLSSPCTVNTRNSTFNIDNQNKSIKINYGSYMYLTFQIENYDTFNGTVLILKLIEWGNNDPLPLNGVYTLKKQ